MIDHEVSDRACVPGTVVGTFVDDLKIVIMIVIHICAKTWRSVSFTRIVNPLRSDVAFAHQGWGSHGKNAPFCYTKNKFCQKICRMNADSAFLSFPVGSVENWNIPVVILVKKFSVWRSP